MSDKWIYRLALIFILNAFYSIMNMFEKDYSIYILLPIFFNTFYSFIFLAIINLYNN